MPTVFQQNILHQSVHFSQTVHLYICHNSGTQTKISNELFYALWLFKILNFSSLSFTLILKKEIKDEKNNFVQILGT